MEFPATLDHLKEMMDYLDSEAKSHGVEEKAISRIQLACEEAIVNIIYYASSRDLSITCERVACRFIITLKDRGIPFNPIDFEVNPQTNTPTLERKEGGLGIYLIRKMIDEARYQRLDDENILVLTFSCEN